MIRRHLLLWACLAAAVAVSPHDQVSICDLRICRCDLASKLSCACDAKTQEIVLQANGAEYLPRSLGSINIENCHHVRIASRSIHDITPLRKVSLTNISYLELDREAFSWDTTKILETYQEPGIDIFITKSTIPEIKSEVFKGHLNSIFLNYVNVTLVAPLAFANTAVMERIEILNSRIEKFSPKSFNKLILDSFIIEGGYIGTIPSNTMNSVEVLNNLRFEGVHIDSIRSSAFKITEPKTFKLLACDIKLLEGQAFMVTTKGDIFINDNIFANIHQGAFLGINLDTREALMSDLVLENNTLIKFEDKAFAFNTSKLKINIDRIKIEQQCDCDSINRWSTKLVMYSGYNPSNSFSKLMWCNSGKIEVGVDLYQLKHCGKHQSKVPIIIASLIGILVFLICLCFVGFWVYRKHAKRYMNVPTRDANRLSVNSNHIIVVPECKIYRENELNIMTESVEPIKEYIAPRQEVST